MKVTTFHHFRQHASSESTALGDNSADTAAISHYAVRATWHATDTEFAARPNIVLQIALASLPLSDVWEAYVTKSQLERAVGKDEGPMEVFEQRLRAALEGCRDKEGMTTGCEFDEGVSSSRLSLYVLDAAGQIKFELIKIQMTPTTREKLKMTIWSDFMTSLLFDRSELKSCISERDKTVATLNRDLQVVKKDFSVWVDENREKAETQMFKKFRAVLNEKKAKIRSLLAAIDLQERRRKEAEEQLEAARRSQHVPEAEAEELPDHLLIENESNGSLLGKRRGDKDEQDDSSRKRRGKNKGEVQEPHPDPQATQISSLASSHYVSADSGGKSPELGCRGISGQSKDIKVKDQPSEAAAPSVIIPTRGSTMISSLVVGRRKPAAKKETLGVDELFKSKEAEVVVEKNESRRTSSRRNKSSLQDSLSESSLLRKL